VRAVCGEASSGRKKRGEEEGRRRGEKKLER
jgi:hypothetical protein